jgi:hypothetical protein
MVHFKLDRKKTMNRAISIAALALVVGGAQAADVKQAATPQAHAQVVSATSLSVGKDFKVSPSDYPNGVFVRVKEVFGERPISASLFAAMLHERGFKIADKAENADVVMLIRSSTFNFKDIDQNSGSVSAQKVDGVAGAAIAAIATGGLSLLATDFSFLSNKKPVYASMSVLLSATKNGDAKEQETGLTGSIKGDGSVQGTRESFILFSNEWFKMHVRNTDVEQPAFSAAPAKTMDAAAASTKP